MSHKVPGRLRIRRPGASATGSTPGFPAPKARRRCSRAATAEATDCIVVTGNEMDFAGVEVFNPLKGAKP